MRADAGRASNLIYQNLFVSLGSFLTLFFVSSFHFFFFSFAKLFTVPYVLPHSFCVDSLYSLCLLDIIFKTIPLFAGQTPTSFDHFVHTATSALNLLHHPIIVREPISPLFILNQLYPINQGIQHARIIHSLPLGHVGHRSCPGTDTTTKLPTHMPHQPMPPRIPKPNPTTRGIFILQQISWHGD